jgi:hypothetical protein
MAFGWEEYEIDNPKSSLLELYKYYKVIIRQV